MKRKILILFAHPALEKSRVNKCLMQKCLEIDGVTLHDLYEAYPDFHLDVPAEQKRLLDHDVIIFQHPFYWYSSPAILKEYQDLVLQYGWAYGNGGEKLKGKIFFNLTSTGGPREAYQADGRNRFTMRQLLIPFEQTAHLCGMKYLAPFVIHKSLSIRGEQDMTLHHEALKKLFHLLQTDTLDLEKAMQAERLNDLLLINKE